MAARPSAGEFGFKTKSRPRAESDRRRYGCTVKPRLALIAAIGTNSVIGHAGAIPWRLSTDQRRFRQLTLGKPILMGRKTYESIGRPLPGRPNIVISSRPVGGDVIVARSLDEALTRAAGICAESGADEINIGGGGVLYAATIDRADRLYITHVEASPEGDAFFPAIDPARWRASSREHVPAGEKDSHPSTFIIYERR